MNQFRRNKLARIANYLVKNKDKIGYLQDRPMKSDSIKSYADLKKYFKGGGTLNMDCSESVTLIYRLAGCQDPNKNNFNGQGNSETMYGRLKHYSEISHARRGALMTYGPNGANHVIMVLGKDKTDPIVFSHGSVDGPLKLRLSSENTAHPGDLKTFLDVSKL